MPGLETPVMVLSKCSLVTAHYLRLDELMQPLIGKYLPCEMRIWMGPGESRKPSH